MPRVKEISDIIEKYAPKSSAESYDNVGLLVGDENAELKGIMLAVDVTREVVDEAVNCGCNLIISHHPVIFTPITNLLLDTVKGRLIADCIKNEISLYAAHTNVDNMKGNMSWWLAEAIGGTNIKSLTEAGLGAIFDIEPIKFGDLKARIAKAVSDKNIKSVGNPNNLVKRCVVVSGAGGRDEMLVNLARANGAEVYVSGEFRFDIAVTAAQSNYRLIDVGHYNSEKPFLEIMYNMISKTFNGKIIKSKNEVNPFNKEN